MQGTPNPVKNTDERAHEFDVAVSFAGPERLFAKRLASLVNEAGFKVFYDAFYSDQLWGKNLCEFFDKIYRKSSRFCVMFISKEYKERMWTTFERKSSLARAIEEKGNEYILPIIIDQVEMDGIDPTICHLSINEYSIEQIAALLIKKLNGRS